MQGGQEITQKQIVRRTKFLSACGPYGLPYGPHLTASSTYFSNNLTSFEYNVKFLLLSLMVGIVAFCAQNEISWLPPPPPEAEWAPEEEIEVRTADLAALLALRQNDKNIIVDTRREQYYDYGHIAGAVNIPAFQDIQELSGEQLQALREASNIVLYATGDQNAGIKRMARALIEAGIPQVQVYSGGWSQWKSCQLSVEGESDVSR